MSPRALGRFSGTHGLVTCEPQPLPDETDDHRDERE
jgi:hypothetical protein